MYVCTLLIPVILRAMILLCCTLCTQTKIIVEHLIPALLFTHFAVVIFSTGTNIVVQVVVEQEQCMFNSGKLVLK